METLLSQKQQLITWISTLEDQETITVLSNIKQQTTFNFDEEFKKGIPLEEARRKSLEKVRELWKR